MQMFGSFPDELLAEFHAAYAEASKTQKDCGPGEKKVGPKKQGKPSAKRGAKTKVQQPQTKQEKPAKPQAPTPQPPAHQAAATLTNPNASGAARQAAINFFGKGISA